jgi:DNA-binding MltR family transcriptional regulator
LAGGLKNTSGPLGENFAVGIRIVFADGIVNSRFNDDARKA